MASQSSPRLSTPKRSGAPQCLAGVLLGLALVAIPSTAWSRPLTLGIISHTPAQTIRKFLPLAGNLAEQMRGDGIEKGKVLLAAGVSQLAAFMQSGEADYAIGDPFVLLAVNRLGGSEIRLRGWKGKHHEYSSVIFVGKESGIKDLYDLQGRVIAFKTPLSSSGYWLPKMVLSRKGATLRPLFDASDSVPADAVGYVFSRDDENTVLWVLRGKVAAGALRQDQYRKYAGKNRTRLRVIHTTFAVPVEVVAFSTALPARLASKLEKLLLRMGGNETQRDILAALDGTTKFDPLPSKARALLSNAAESAVGRLAGQ